ncbi:EAL domain-containing protein [Sinorhizobium sp. RAC02]|uniref:putative bifunctional diguanylate cyclase/phosphodiesterase n=1 Tax=Sinorhizobium sp. RAC02 TaxID=1842534 RepID=UPI00256FA8A5|nr:EAL domain-containing protein [Sinorhizobium sp. RAC02]
MTIFSTIPSASTTLVAIVSDNSANAQAVGKVAVECGLAFVHSVDYAALAAATQNTSPVVIVLDSLVSHVCLIDVLSNAKLRKIPVIQLIEPDEESRVRAFRSGAVDCIYKPVFANELGARLKMYVELELAKARLIKLDMQFATTLDNIGQGVCFFDARQKLILSNRRYAEVYGLPIDAIRPGMTLSEISDLRYALDACPTVPQDEYLAFCESIKGDTAPKSWYAELKCGKVVRVHHQRTPDGGWVSTHEDVTISRNLEGKVTHLASHDPLTDLPNRAAVIREIDGFIRQHSKKKSRFVVFSLGFDKFQEVNDDYGTDVGDAVLCGFADRLRAFTSGAFIARLGGDEFSVVASAGTSQALKFADELAELAKAYEIDGIEVRVSTSIGASFFPTDGTDASTLLAKASAALFRAKAEGRGVTRFFEAQSEKRTRERRALQRDMQNAVHTHQFALHFQPQASINGEVLGFEALLRWEHPTRGNLSPAGFVPLAEESGIINEIGAWALREACHVAAGWPEKLQIAVNLSPVQFRSPGLPQLVKRILTETGLSPHRLELEITEGVFVDDFKRAKRVLRDLKSIGVRIVMDDFGTGYSSLSYLQSLPFDKLKIDRSFVTNIGRSQSAAIVRAIINLGRGMRLPVVAEGVETPKQLAFLAREACDKVQGYLIGRPEPITEYAVYTGVGKLEGHGRHR